MSQLKKLEGNNRFAPNEFNKNFISADEEETLVEESESESEVEEEDKKIDLNINDSMNFEPSSHMEDLGIHIKNLFFKIIELLANGENPLPYIMSNSRRQFVFAVMIIIIGGLMLFLSNLMISN